MPFEDNLPLHEVWLYRACSDLNISRQNSIPDVFLEDLCYHAQQAVEKALKALMVRRNVSFPKTHDIQELLQLVRNQGIPLPESFSAAAGLAGYAVQSRYPGAYEPVTEAEWKEAVRMAEEVIQWVKASFDSNSDTSNSRK